MTNDRDLADASATIKPGPGGYHCPCCMKFHIRKHSHIIHRIFRRCRKNSLKKSLMEGDHDVE